MDRHRKCTGRPAGTPQGPPSGPGEPPGLPTAQTPRDLAAASAEELAQFALRGDRDALGKLVERLQDDVFGIALRMLGNREDAEDAAQEILVRIVTRLSQFDFRSRLKTWAYRIAVNHVLDLRKSAAQRQRRRFEELGEEIEARISGGGPSEAERSLLVEEVKIACTLGMLQCLDQGQRAAFILGEIMELPGAEAAAILEITPALFRKRLQMARAAMTGFLKRHCGLVSDEAPCRCHRMVPLLPQAEQPRLASREISFAELRTQVRRVEQARSAMAVHRSSHPRPSVDFARRLMAALDVHFRQGDRA
ncbi:MAG: RNA polymerase sigma factor [Bryobacteraceae bacterium]|nr:RNA polymerase sigma factor [Bryobacteraceae bacterium]